jgi:hypothetical protein
MGEDGALPGVISNLLFAQQFGRYEDENSSAHAATGQEVYERITSGREKNQFHGRASLSERLIKCTARVLECNRCAENWQRHFSSPPTARIPIAICSNWPFRDLD